MEEFQELELLEKLLNENYYKTKKNLPNTECASSHVLSLPIHPKVGTSDLEKMQRVFGNKK